MRFVDKHALVVRAYGDLVGYTYIRKMPIYRQGELVARI